LTFTAYFSVVLGALDPLKKSLAQFWKIALPYNETTKIFTNHRNIFHVSNLNTNYSFIPKFINHGI